MPLLSKELKESGFAKSSGGGNYLKLSNVSEGDKVRFTILGDNSIVGHQVWIDGPEKGIPLNFKDVPSSSDIEERAAEVNGKPRVDAEIKKFMAFAIWNYEDQKVQLFQFTQTSIATPLIAYLSDEEIEAETELYDFVLSATGTNMDKRYSVTALPGRRRKADVNKQVEAAWGEAMGDGFDLTRLFSGADPFKAPF